MSAVSKVAAANTDDHANTFMDEISDLSAINRWMEDEKKVSNDSLVRNEVCEDTMNGGSTVLTSAYQNMMAHYYMQWVVKGYI